MKKIFGALMIAVCIGMAMPAQAQIHFGVKGGLNLSKASFSNVSENFKKDNFTGFFIGPMAEFNIPIVGLGVDASLLFAQRGIKVSEGNDDITVKQNGIDIPVNLKYTIGLGSLAGIYLAAGPDFYFDFEKKSGIDKKKAEVGINAGITPIEIKEILYQAVAYAGMAKVMDFVGITNEVLLAHGVRLPLEGQAVVSAETRFDKGLALQKSIFGERIDQMHKNAPENQKHIQRYLSANCFGDYQTRGGLDVKTRELLTFSILVSLGGCESQVKGHIQGNVNVGNSKDTLLAVVTQLLPYIGYPRTLNAIACLNEVIPEDK